MIRRGTAVNYGESLEELPALGSVAGVDFAASEANVSRWGGSVSRYRHAVRRALDQLSAPDARRSTASAPSRHGGPACWAPPRRSSPDARPGRCGPDRGGRRRLGLPPDRVHDFRVGQQASRWPGRCSTRTRSWCGSAVPRSRRHLVGAAAPSVASRRQVRRLVPCAPDHWLLEADVFGIRLTPGIRCPNLSKVHPE